MPLTKKEQTVFEEMFSKIMDDHPDSLFIGKMAGLIFEMTGNVNLRMRLYEIEKKLSCYEAKHNNTKHR